LVLAMRFMGLAPCSCSPSAGRWGARPDHPISDGHERQPDDASILPVKAERHGEQPAHAGVQPVKGTQPSNRKPWPQLE
jgi:hypothetical protein